MKKIIPARAETLPEDYQALGLNPDYIAPWEDGCRTTGRRGEFEWWYFDSKMEDGASLVAVFYNNPFISKGRGFHPSVTLTLTRADGTRLHVGGNVPADQCSFSTDGCQVRIGDSTFTGDLHNYHIHVAWEDVTADITLDGNVPPWRPGTGRIRFGEKDYFAWIPAVPEGSVTAVITTPEGTETYHGSGYHDHNWGNTMMLKLMHHWYWGRAKIGDYQVISSYITGQKKYGYRHAPVFLLVKNGVPVGDLGAFPNVTYTQSSPAFDAVTGKHYFQTLSYDYDAGDARYVITYQVQGFIEKSRMGTDKQPIKALLAVRGLAPGYIRFTGTATLQKIVDDQVVETVSNPAIWELMYFGKDADV